MILTWDLVIEYFFTFVVPILLFAFLAWFLDTTYRGVIERRIMSAVKDFDRFAQEHIRREVRREIQRRAREWDLREVAREYDRQREERKW